MATKLPDQPFLIAVTPISAYGPERKGAIRRGHVTQRSLLLAYGLTNATLYSMLLPLWEGFDEPFHFGYVQYLANGNGFPDPRTSRLSEEVGSSLVLAPASPSVQRNLPEVTCYSQFLAWPESQRQRIHQQLGETDRALRWQPSHFLNYEAQQAPLAYAALAFPEWVLEKVPLPSRVLLLRIVAGTVGGFLLFFGAERLGNQLGLSDPYKQIAMFCALSSQMIWATLAHVTNDWLAVSLTLWLLVMVIHYEECPNPRRVTLVSAVLLMGLLTKAYFLAFVPLLISVCILRRRWRDLALGLALLLALAGPWYVRNLERYGTISGMQELRGGADPMPALRAIHIEKIPAALDSYARGALWTANNTFRAFSIATLRTVVLVWLVALLLWAGTRQRRPEWTVIFFSGLFSLALGYDSAITYVASHHESASPGVWYAQVLLVPMLSLGLLGASRSGRAGRVVAASMVLLFGYILVATYWVKLMPLYGGFDGRTSLASVTMLYRKQLSTLVVRLNEVCLAPAAVILLLSGLIAGLVFAQQIVLIRRLFLVQCSSAKHRFGIW